VKGSILHIHWTFPPTTGGVESYLLDVARLQARDGWRVTVLTGEDAPLTDPSYEVVSTEMLDINRARAAFVSGAASAAAPLAELVLGLVSSRDVSVIHGHNLHHFSPTPALAVDEVRNAARIPTHHTFHETWPDVLTAQPIYRGWEGNYAISNFVGAGCETLIGYRPEVLRLGVDTERFTMFSPPFKDRQAFRILHPARLLPWKGVDVSIEALRLLRDWDFDARLILTDTQRIADWDEALPSYRRRLLALVRDNHLTPHVAFVSAPYAQMASLYNAVDVVLYPTIKDEPFGLVPLEAMACGRPVVASTSGGIVESVENGVTGWLVAPSDPEALARKIADLLSEPDRAAAMGLAGRRRVEEMFSAETHVWALGERYARPRRAAEQEAGSDPGARAARGPEQGTSGTSPSSLESPLVRAGPPRLSHAPGCRTQ
jgi:glycosyltransferase involved in cell wall biosynthesis